MLSTLIKLDCPEPSMLAKKHVSEIEEEDFVNTDSIGPNVGCV